MLISMVTGIYINTMCTFQLFKLLKILHILIKKRARSDKILYYDLGNYKILSCYYIFAHIITGNHRAPSPFFS